MLIKSIRRACSWYALLMLVSSLTGLEGPALGFPPPSARRSGGNQGAKPTPTKTPDGEPVVSKNQQGRIVKYKPDVDEADPALVGELTFLPSFEEAKPMRLLVRDSEHLKVTVGDHQFTAQELPDVLYKGLYCTVGWDYEGVEKDKDVVDESATPPDGKPPKTPGPRKKMQLLILKLDAIEVVGTVEKIGDAELIVRGLPTAGRDWPDSGKEKVKSGKVKKIIPRKLKLALLEEVAKYGATANESMSLSDFKEGDEVQASIVYGRKKGMLVRLQPSTGSAVQAGSEENNPPPSKPKQPRRPDDNR